MFSILIWMCLVTESHIGSLIKVWEVSFLHDVFRSDQALYWPDYKKLGARWETICDHDIPAHSRTGADWASRTDWPSLTRQTWYWEQGGSREGTHCVLLPPRLHQGNLQQSFSALSQQVQVSISVHFFQHLHQLASSLQMRGEREPLHRQTVTQMLPFSPTNNVALWIFSKSFSKIFQK